MIDTLDLPRDDSGRIVGYGVGREARMRDWQHERETRAFERLVAILKSRRWAMAHPDERRAIHRAYNRTAKGKARQQTYRDRVREERLREVIYVCERCSATWCPVPWRRARTDVRYCSQRCQHAAWRERTGVRS